MHSSEERRFLQPLPAAPEYGLDTLTEFEPSSTEVAVVRAQKFSFDGRSPGSDELVVLANGIDASWWSSGALHVVLHSKSSWVTGGAGGPTTGVLAVEVIPVRLAEDSPGTTYVSVGGGVGGGTVASLSVTAASTSKTYQVAGFSNPFGPSVRVQLRFSQGAIFAANPQTATLSVYLVGRSG